MSEPFAPKVTQIHGLGMVTLRGDLSEPDVAAAMAAVCDVALPAVGQMTENGGRILAWMSPDEALLMCPVQETASLAEALNTALAQYFATVVDVSDARCVFEVAGPGCRETLAKLTPVDLHPAHFAPGTMRRTRLAQVAIALWMPGPERIRLMCFRSVAQYVDDVLMLSAARAGALSVFPNEAPAQVSR